MSTPIVAFWQRDEKSVKAAQLDLAGRSLQIEADRYLMDAAVQVAGATTGLESAKTASLKRPDFASLVNATLELRRSELTLSEAASVYEEVFGAPSAYVPAP